MLFFKRGTDHRLLESAGLTYILSCYYSPPYAFTAQCVCMRVCLWRERWETMQLDRRKRRGNGKDTMWYDLGRFSTASIVTWVTGFFFFFFVMGSIYFYSQVSASLLLLRLSVSMSGMNSKPVGYLVLSGHGWVLWAGWLSGRDDVCG